MTVSLATTKNEIRQYINRVVIYLDMKYDIPVVFERDADTALYHTGRQLVDGDFIVVNNRVKLEKQLYMLLHEAGHVLLREDTQEHIKRFPAAESKRGKAFTVDTLREEVLAWEAGRDMARNFDIPVDNKLWSSMVTSALHKYIKWSNNA